MKPSTLKLIAADIRLDLDICWEDAEDAERRILAGLLRVRRLLKNEERRKAKCPKRSSAR